MHEGLPKTQKGIKGLHLLYKGVGQELVTEISGQILTGMKNVIYTIAILILAGLRHEAHSQNFGWAKQVGGPMSDYCASIAVDSSGNIYTLGTFLETVDFDPGPGTFYMTSTVNHLETFISKSDASGNFLWAKQMGRSDYASFRSMTIDAFGNVYTTGALDGWADFDPGPGSFPLGGGSQGAVFISKIDANGNFGWAKTIGGLFEEQGDAISVDPMGNVYVVGLFSSTVDFDPNAGEFYMTSVGGGSFNTFILKLDASGSFVWAKQFNAISCENEYSIINDAQGNLYATGWFAGTPDFDPNAGIFTMASEGGSFDVFILKMNPAGNFVWAKQLGGTGNERGYSIVVDGSQNLYATGYSTATADFDPGPGTYNLTPVGSYSFYIVKLDSLGGFGWAKHIGAIGGNDGKGVAVDFAGNVYTTSWFTGTINLYPGAGSFGLTSKGSDDVFISKLSPAGDLVWVKQVGGIGKDRAFSINSDASGNVYAAGYFNGTVDFDPGPGIFNLVSSGNSDVFTLKLNNPTTAVTEPVQPINLRIFPNPSENEIYIELANYSRAIAAIYSMEGQLKFHVVLQSNQTALPLSYLPSGIYLMQVRTIDGTFTKKFVKN